MIHVLFSVMAAASIANIVKSSLGPVGLDKMLVDDIGVCIERILGECLLISSLPGKALRTLVDIARLAERFNMHSQSRAW